ncbi:MAG: TerB family tellurite resistance protein [Clostridia bacterium]|nr:TerB family tellurite resistance protein [Clostridia bacterium]
MVTLEQYVDSFKMKHESFLAGCDSIEEMGLWDKEKLGEMDVFYSTDLASVIIRLIAVDGKITPHEVEYLNKTFAFDYTLEELEEVYANCYDDIGQAFDEAFENGITHMRKINEKLADAYKELLSLVCEIIIASDGVLTTAEIDEVKRLKALCD